MRIAPLAFVDATDDEICEVSAITHAHRTSTDACVIFVELMRGVMNGTFPSWALHLKGVSEQEIRSGGFVRDTLKAATWCFVNTSSYEDCVLAAVNLGDDTDTTAAVAGALAGTAIRYRGHPAGMDRHPTRQRADRTVFVLGHVFNEDNVSQRK